MELPSILVSDDHPDTVETISEQLRGLAAVAEESAFDLRISQDLVLVSIAGQLQAIAARL